MTFLRRAAGRAAQRHAGLASLEGEGASVVLGSWLAQLSCALQKGNVACLRGAAAGGRRGARAAESRQEEEEPDWLEEAVKDLLAHAAACAAAAR